MENYTVLELAQKYYYKHINLCPILFDFTWDQASEEYREVFLKLAEMDLEDSYVETNQ